MTQPHSRLLPQILGILIGTLLSGCDSTDVKIVDVPRKDIPKEMYNKPIPPEAFKAMNPAARKQTKKMEILVKQAAEKNKVSKGE